MSKGSPSNDEDVTPRMVDDTGGDSSRLLTTNEAAQLLNVSSQTILNYIERDEIPYIQLPGGGGRRRREFRIPMKGLLESLTGNYNPVQEINELSQSLDDEADSKEEGG
jgi:excisionase family DNA binding protein